MGRSKLQHFKVLVFYRKVETTLVTRGKRSCTYFSISDKYIFFILMHINF